MDYEWTALGEFFLGSGPQAGCEVSVPEGRGMQFWFRGCQIGLSQGPYLAGIRDSGAAPRPEASRVVQTG